MQFYHNGTNDAPQGPQVLSFRPSDAVHTVRSKELCGSGTEVRYDSNGRKVYVHRHFCKRWDHRPCAAHKARQWIAKAKAHDDLWAGVIDIGGSEALRKKVSRRKGEYFSVCRDGKSLFFATVPIEGFDRVASSQERESLLHDWLVPTVEEWGKNKRVRHSRGWGRSQPDASANQEDNNMVKNQENGQVMAQNGHPKMVRLVFVEPAKEVIGVLEDLGSRVRGDVEDLVAPPSEESGRAARVTINLSDSAVKLLDLLTTGAKDPEGRVHLAWTPKVGHDVPDVRSKP